MKYLLLIAALAASVGLAQATNPGPKTAGCCDGGGCCRPHKACCSGVQK